VGRVANRIAAGSFTLDGVRYGPLAINNGANHLHGGTVGFDKVYWRAAPFTSPGGGAGVAFSHASAAGDEGYPGALAAESRYELTAADELVMTFSATSDAPTPVNLCNHTYWNLSGGNRAATIEAHTLRSPCTHYLPVDGGSIPTGEVAPVAGTPFDFTAATPLGARLRDVAGGERGYDHCLCRAGPSAVPPAGLGLGRIAELRDPASGRAMTVDTTAPGVQLYTANYLSKDAKEAPFTQYGAVCLETQNYPDACVRRRQRARASVRACARRVCCLRSAAPRSAALRRAAPRHPPPPRSLPPPPPPRSINKPNFPSPVLRPGETYKHVAVHKFTW
jgi:aldose 1-epimerase